MNGETDNLKSEPIPSPRLFRNATYRRRVGIKSSGPVAVGDNGKSSRHLAEN